MLKILTIAILITTSLTTHAISFTDAILNQSSEELNRDLPRQIDKLTWLINVSALPNRTVVFNYQINTDELLKVIAHEMGISTDNLWEQARKKHKNPELLYAEAIDNIFSIQAINANCTTPSIRNMIDDGVTMLHTYYRRDGVYITELRVNINSCIIDPSAKSRSN